MFFVLSKLLDVLLAPLTWGLVLLALAVPWRARDRRSWRRRRALGVAGAVVLLFFSSGYVENALLGSLERAVPSSYQEGKVYDAVVLLGGIGDERVWASTGEPSYNDNVERLIVTRRLLRDGRARFAILSGGTNDPRLAKWSEAAMLAKTLRDWGIADDRLILEDHAKNTRENAVLSAEIVRARGFGRVLVVTSAFHVPRAADCFRAVGIDVDFLPTDYRSHPRELSLGELLPRTSSLFGSTMVIRELFGRVVYRAQGYGKPAP